MEDFFQNFKNSIDFYLRQRLNFSRRNFSVKNEQKGEPQEREKILLEKYNLSDVRNNSTKQNYAENLYTIDLLDRYLAVEKKEKIRVLDIGCKNWFYAKAEHFFFKSFCKDLKLDGIEIDSNRLYRNFFSRGEVAKANIKDLSGTTYIAGDFLNHNKKYDYIVWILPFVFINPLLKWGLPVSCFNPEKMLLHAYNSLHSGGNLFIINQGKTEYNEQKRLYNELKIPFMDIGPIENEFLEYKICRYLSIVNK